MVDFSCNKVKMVAIYAFLGCFVLFYEANLQFKYFNKDLFLHHFLRLNHRNKFISVYLRTKTYSFSIHENHKPFSRRLLHASVHSSEHVHNNKSPTLIWHKVGSCAVLFLVALIGCSLPWIVNRRKLINTLDNSFSALCIRSLVCGTFLGFVLFHLIPETLELQHSVLSSSSSSPVAPLLESLTSSFIFLGFISMVLFEKVFDVHEFSHETDDHRKFLSLEENEVSYQKKKEVEHKTENTQSSHDLLHTVNNYENNTIPCSTTSRLNSCQENSAITEVTFASHKYKSSYRAPKKTSGYAIYGLLLLPIFCIFIHCVYEGFIVGSVQSATSVWITVLAIAGHKWAVGLALAVHFLHKGLTTKLLLTILVIFALSSPIGVLAGLFAVELNEWVEVVVTGIGAGGILYMGCDSIFRQFDDRKSKQRSRLVQFFFMFLGAFIIFIFTVIHLFAEDE